jgi:hypothetical protein
MAGVTTFDIFKSLLQTAVNEATSIDSATKASMTTRITELAKQEIVDLTYATVDSTGGFVTVDDANKSIEVAIGSPGTNRVEWDELTWQVPRQIRGTPGTDGGAGNGGFWLGEIGTSVTAVKVPEADITLQYRLGTADANWKNFDDTTILDGVTAIIFGADIADQPGAAAVLQALHIYAEQE